MKSNKIKLDEVVDFQNGGSWKQVDYRNEGIPVVQVSNIKNGIIEKNNIKFLDKSKFEKYKKHELKKGDLIISTVGSHPDQILSAVGKTAIVSEKEDGYLLNQNAVRLRSKNKNLDQKYLGYLGKSHFMKEFIAGRARGAANQVRMPIESLKEFEFELPPIYSQNKIANILSKYDDLIENNLKRIELLEEAAQIIYKEWFIDFKFPGYEKVKVENGIPEGWEKTNLYDICSVQMGYAFKGKYFNENKEGIPAIRIRDIPDQKTKTYTTEKANEEYLVKSGDILIGMDGIFHNDVWCGEEGYLVQRVCRLRTYQENIQGFIWQAIKEPINYYNNTIVGATVAHLGAKHLKEIFIKHPKIEKNNFFKPLNDLMKQKILLETQNHKLIEARDSLLPKLMKGEIEV